MENKEKYIWVSSSMSTPLRGGIYTCLVEIDEYGTLDIVGNCEFNGFDWCFFNSCAQFTRYWLASKEEYKEISEKLNKEQEDLHNK